jgi:putative intracellular protease/amidase
VRVLVICAKQYNGHELWTALGIMQNRGISFEVVSTELLIKDEITFQPNVIKRTVDDLVEDEMSTFDGIMIVSGNMKDTEAYWRDQRVLHQIKKAEAFDKPIAAICCSVPTIREVAKGKRVSFFPLLRSRALLEDAGAVLTTVAVSVDGKLCTAEHQMATQLWATAFANILEGKPHGLTLVDSGFTPKGRERKPIKEIEALKRRKNLPS